MAGEPPTAAMRTAGYSDYTARSKAVPKVRESKIAETIQELMDRKGITDERLLDVLEDGLKATKVISAMVIAKSGEGMADANSMTKDFVEVDDYAVRHKYMETGLKMKGHLKDVVSNPAGMPTSINIAFMRSDKAPTEILVISKGPNGSNGASNKH